MTITPEQFESETRAALEQTLNQLHTAALMVAQLETQLAETGRTVQLLSRQIEMFVEQCKATSPSSTQTTLPSAPLRSPDQSPADFLGSPPESTADPTESAIENPSHLDE